MNLWKPLAVIVAIVDTLVFGSIIQFVIDNGTVSPARTEPYDGGAVLFFMGLFVLANVVVAWRAVDSENLR